MQEIQRKSQNEIKVRTDRTKQRLKEIETKACVGIQDQKQESKTETRPKEDGNIKWPYN